MQASFKCDFLYSCAAADKISTDSARRAVPLRQLSYFSHRVAFKIHSSHGIIPQFLSTRLVTTYSASDSRSAGVLRLCVICTRD